MSSIISTTSLLCFSLTTSILHPQTLSLSLPPRKFPLLRCSITVGRRSFRESLHFVSPKQLKDSFLSMATTVMSLAEKVLERVYGTSKSAVSVAGSEGEKTQRHTHHHIHRSKSYDDSDDDPCYSDEDESAMELVQIGAERTKNVLILMSDTGGGHRASAEAIRDAFQIQFGDKYRIIVKDVWKEYTGWPLNDMERSYKFMVKHVQLWKVAFHGTSPKWIHSCYLAAIAAYYAKEVEAGLMEYKPEIIISVHPLMQHIPLWVLKWQELQKRVLFVTVITDLNTCHPTWFHPGVNRCYCPSQEVAKRALFDGLDESQVRVFGLPVRPSFARAVLVKDDLRKELEMDQDLRAVLLMGGGEGMGPVKETAKALEESLYDKENKKPIGQMVVICGRNKKLASALEAVEWKIPVKVRGFETQMEKWMGACDCIITKAGPGTIAESLIRSLPIILNDYIPGQEKGNVPYVVENGAGVFTRSPKETARIVGEWFSTKTDELEHTSDNARKLAQPEAVFDIVKDIDELTEQRGPLANVSYTLTSSFASLV